VISRTTLSPMAMGTPKPHAKQTSMGLCQRFCAEEIGRPGLPPGRYFRLLLIGYFEGLDAERAIAWRADGHVVARVPDVLGSHVRL
jgi:hypothetical protein